MVCHPKWFCQQYILSDYVRECIIWPCFFRTPFYIWSVQYILMVWTVSRCMGKYAEGQYRVLLHKKRSFNIANKMKFKFTLQLEICYANVMCIFQQYYADKVLTTDLSIPQIVVLRVKYNKSVVKSFRICRRPSWESNPGSLQTYYCWTWAKVSP